MLSEQELKRHHADLEFLKGTLESMGLSLHLEPASAENPVPYLSGFASEQTDGPGIGLQLVHVPGDSFEEVALLQIFLLFTTPIKKQFKAIQELLPAINDLGLMGYFNLDQEQQLFYRYVYARPRFEVPNEAAFLELFHLLMSNFTSLGATLMQLEYGYLTKQEVLKELFGG